MKYTVHVDKYTINIHNKTTEVITKPLQAFDSKEESYKHVRFLREDFISIMTPDALMRVFECQSKFFYYHYYVVEVIGNI